MRPGLFVALRRIHNQSGSLKNLEREWIEMSTVDSYPKENTCAKTIAALVELRLGSSLSTDEIAYLTLHCARLSMPTPAQ
ncbi:MAG: PRD domain-containing protein [Schaalia turicensis]|nr:PRD domain-containing protein [Schaalia turicensis]